MKNNSVCANQILSIKETDRGRESERERWRRKGRAKNDLFENGKNGMEIELKNRLIESNNKKKIPEKEAEETKTPYMIDSH